MARSIEQRDAVDLRQANGLVREVGVQGIGVRGSNRAIANLLGDAAHHQVDGLQAARRLLGEDEGARVEIPAGVPNDALGIRERCRRPPSR